MIYSRRIVIKDTLVAFSSRGMVVEEEVEWEENEAFRHVFCVFVSTDWLFLLFMCAQKWRKMILLSILARNFHFTIVFILALVIKRTRCRLSN